MRKKARFERADIAASRIFRVRTGSSEETDETTTQFGFGADAFTGFQRALEKTIKHGAGGPVFVGETIGFANLTEDFGFAEEERVQSGGNAEEMADGGAIIVLVEDAVENVGAN
jgi:hypothetical protein